MNFMILGPPTNLCIRHLLDEHYVSYKLNIKNSKIYL